MDSSSKQNESGFEKYQAVAETVGMIPSANLNDNLFQGACVAVTTLAGAIIGYLAGQETLFLMLGGLAGLMVGGFGSGLVIMVWGLQRAKKKKSGSLNDNHL